MLWWFTDEWLLEVIETFEAYHVVSYQYVHDLSGVASYCDRYGEMIYNISSQMGPIPKLDSSSEAAKRMERELVSKIPLDQLDERRK